MSVPEGLHTIVTEGPLGSQPITICRTAQVRIEAWKEHDISLACELDPTGRWRTLDGRVLLIDSNLSGGYSVKVLDGDDMEIGTGSAYVSKRNRLVISFQDIFLGASQAIVRLGNFGARGYVKVSSIGHDENPFVLERDER